MASTRLRRTFKYPSDNDLDAEQSSDLDEEEQEALINRLQVTSRSTDASYIRIFTTLPLLCIPAFLFFLFQPSSTPSVRFICILAATSLLASSLTMFLTPVGDNGKAKSTPGVLIMPGIQYEVDSDGPLGRSAPLLNPIICGILVVAAFGMRRRLTIPGGHEGIPEGFWMFCLLPGLVLTVVAFAKKTMKDVEEGIGELTKMKYGLKGA